MIPSGAAHNEMILSASKDAIDEQGKKISVRRPLCKTLLLNPHTVFIQQNKQIERHTFSVLVDNVSGTLARVVAMFSARGYNLESLNVSAIDKDRTISRINIVTTGDKNMIRQIQSQISRIVAVRKVMDVTEDEHIEREFVLIKVKASGTERREALRLAEI